MLWAIWLSRNDAAFNKIPISSSMQVIVREHIRQEYGQTSLEGREENDTSSFMSFDRNYDNGDLHQTWMVVF
jgi:hypothetical protein